MMYNTKARWNSKCSETGKVIPKGENMLYDPEKRKCYSKESEAFKNWINEPDAAGNMVKEASFDDFCNRNNI